MVTATTLVLLPSCDIILAIAIVKLLRVLLEPALLITSSLRLAGVAAGSSAVAARSSITIVSSISIVVSVPRSCKPATLQVHTLSQGMATPAVFGVFRAWTRQNLLCGWRATLVSPRVVVLASDPSICIGYQVRVVSIWPLATSLLLILTLVRVLVIATLSFVPFILVLGFVSGSVLISTCHDFTNCKGNTLIQALLHAT